MNKLDKEIVDTLLSENKEHLVFWMISLFPYSSKEFLDVHEKPLMNREGYHYICKNISDMVFIMAESFEKMADIRLGKSLEKFSKEIRKNFYKNRTRKMPDNPIVKRHIIAIYQDDINKERTIGDEPIKIEVDTP